MANSAPTTLPDPDPRIAAFIARWSDAESAERANYALFLAELCDVLDVPRPDPAGADTAHNAYVFERAVPLHQRDSKTTTGRIDLYKRGCFVLEAKQYAAADIAGTGELALALGDPAPAAARKGKIARGSGAWDDAMLSARGQADVYARNLPAGEPTPPFLLVVDVGHVFELYADFSQQGKAYLPFPDARTHRLRLADLAKPDARERLRAVWLDPRSLDPAKVSAEVTREVAGHLAELAKSFEKNHDAKEVASFLSRCLFCMFAEDVGLLPDQSFKQLLDSVKDDPGAFVPLMELLFEDMNRGRFSGLLKKKLLWFNGGLFSEARALPINGAQLGLLRRAAACQWRHVEPAIFGTLLERALTAGERHKLGAHYTPRAYVERLVLPTVIEPLREDWQAVQAAAITEAKRGELVKARATVRAFHHQLCAVKVLDPACGSGNFLYVALEHLKRLEGEVFDTLGQLGDPLPLDLASETVDPHQFLGLELNPRAAAIAELVLWIGWLQWHFRTRGDALPHEPVLRNFKNIEFRDAVLAYDKKDFARDAAGNIRFVWDRKTMKTDPATGRVVPEDKAVIPLETFSNPREAVWPQADFIVGNPPFLGDKIMRQSLGEGYVETLRATYPDVPESADFVMYWWHKASEMTIDGKCRRFGFITTNSIKQTLNRRVVRRALLQGISLRFAIPDHPWVDTFDGAAVRIAMSVGALSYQLSTPGMVGEPPPPDPSALNGELFVVKSETAKDDGSNDVVFNRFIGRIASDFTIGPDVSATIYLKANDAISVNGMMLAGRGFVLTQDEAKAFGLGKIRGMEKVIRPLLNGRDLTESPRGFYVIDLFGYTTDEARVKFPSVFEAVLTRVKPERDANARAKLKNDWWIFGEPRKTLRAALIGLHRYIATVETSKHRVFQFIDAKMVAEHKLIAIALNDAFHLGVLSSRMHVVFALAAGSTLEDRPVYPKSRCFDPFPFPECAEKQKSKIRALAEELDAHRKRAQTQHGLGLTDIYNVLEKVRAGAALTAKEKRLHEQALVATLRQLHDDLDAAVADAYGWGNLTVALKRAEHGGFTDFKTGLVHQVDANAADHDDLAAEFERRFDAEILERVVALNAARAAEEASGFIRWLRPDYQKPLFADDKQSSLGLTDADALDSKSSSRKKSKAAAPKKKIVWPKPLADRVRVVEAALAAEGQPTTAAELARRFARADAADIAEILHTLVTLGRARAGDAKGTFVR